MLGRPAQQTQNDRRPRRSARLVGGGPCRQKLRQRQPQDAETADVQPFAAIQAVAEPCAGTACFMDGEHIGLSRALGVLDDTRRDGTPVFPG
jgi:hypothetical protein